jgi:DNA topoisomerase-3
VSCHPAGLLVQRDAEIGAFRPEPFYTVNLDCGGFSVASEKQKEKTKRRPWPLPAKAKTASGQGIQRKEKSEKAPALYD